MGRPVTLAVGKIGNVVIELQIEGGRVTVCKEGVILRRRFFKHGVLLDWKNVMFVSPIPAVSRKGNRWETFRGEIVTTLSLQNKNLRFYAFEIAIHDRRQLIRASGFLTRIWLALTLALKPLWTANDLPHPSNGCIHLNLNQRWARMNAQKIIKALDEFEKYSKFDLLVSGE